MEDTVKHWVDGSPYARDGSLQIITIEIEVEHLVVVGDPENVALVDRLVGSEFDHVVGVNAAVVS